MVHRISEAPESLTDLRGRESVFGELLHAETIPLPDHDPLEQELANFIESVRAGGRPAVTGEHGLEVIKIAHSILAAIRRSQAAALP